MTTFKPLLKALLSPDEMIFLLKALEDNDPRLIQKQVVLSVDSLCKGCCFFTFSVFKNFPKIDNYNAYLHFMKIETKAKGFGLLDQFWKFINYFDRGKNRFKLFMEVGELLCEILNENPITVIPYIFEATAWNTAPTGEFKCPKCESYLNQEIPAGQLNLRRCTNCKYIFKIQEAKS